MIDSITLENWKTHKHSALRFGKGTNVLVGVIGSGKSSVMDGLCYGLFGTFPAVQNRRVSVSDLLMRKPVEADAGRVEVCFSIGDKKYKVERILKREGINEGRLWCNETLIAGPKPNQVTERVEKELNVTYELFTRAVYSEQNQVDYFLKLNPGDRKKKFDELLELQKYEGVRANAMQIVNQFRKQEDIHTQSLAQFDAVLQNQDLNELRLNASIQNQKLSALAARKEALVQSLVSLTARAKELELALAQANLLAEKTQRAEAQRDSLRQRKTLIQSQFPSETAQSKPQIEAEKAQLLEKWKTALAQQEQSRAAEAAVQKSVERVRGLESRLTELKTALQSSTLESVEKSLTQFESTLKDSAKATEKVRQELMEASTIVQLSRQQMKLVDMEEKSLSTLHASCPTCKQEISSEHKTKIQSELAGKRNIYSAQEAAAQEKAIQFQSSLAHLESESKKNEIELRVFSLLREKAREFARVQSEQLESKALLAQAQAALAQQGPILSASEMESIQSALARGEKALEFHSLSADETLLSAQLAQFQADFSKMNVSQENVLQARQALSDAQSSLASLDRETALEKKVLDELSARARSVEQLAAQQRILSEKKARAQDVQQSIGLFANVLVETQQQLRETVVEAINAALMELWPWVYPYKDFTLARVLVQDNDYVLTVQERNGNWVSAESSLSGGERSAAALTLRMAIAFVLTRQLSWMILDEPTHNLDVKSVATLSDVLKSRLPELVDQVFVITHSAEIEKSATGSLYVLQREKNEDGCTVPVSKSLAARVE